MAGTALFFFLSGFIFFYIVHKVKTHGFAKIGEEILKKAEKNAREKERQADIQLRQKELDVLHELEKLKNESLKKIQQEKERLEKKEERLESQKEALEKKLREIDEAQEKIRKEKTLHFEKSKSLVEKETLLNTELEKITGMSCKEARGYLLDRTEKEIREEMAQLSTSLKAEAEETAVKRAQKIICEALCRLPSLECTQILSTTVSLPNDEIKKRIIGREGRNIRALEQATGINFVIDDIPGAIVISGFDPVRKEIARMSLQELMKDGRIHPSKIEEVVVQCKGRLEKNMEALAKDAAESVGAYDLHPRILNLLGLLHFQSCLGQNMLSHSLEVSLIMGLMAAELGLNVKLAKRIGLLHDIGKAASHNAETSHALLGSEIALKYGEASEVVNGIACHHEETAPSSLEAGLCSLANKISSERPGARTEIFENYIRRARKLELISSQFEGVEKAYALQTGKEVRVLVLPEVFDDAGAAVLAKNIAKKIEKELSYHDKIKITVIREKRIVEYAT